KDYTVVIHGKPKHEETRATFSHAASHTASIVIKDMNEAMQLGKYIEGSIPPENFYEEFKGRYSPNFDLKKDLQRIGVVNQTTQLASETQAIADFLRKTMMEVYKLDETNIEERFADTRDTLCYATNDNQTAVINLLNTPADLAIVVGGYNSSNTTHLVELCEEKLPTYFINDEGRIISQNEILHFNYKTKQQQITTDFLPNKTPVKILLTSGASCPDALVEGVIRKITSVFPAALSVDQMVTQFQ